MNFTSLARVSLLASISSAALGQIPPQETRGAQRPDSQPAAPAAAPAQAAVAVNYRERPRYAFDPQRLKMRPLLDGSLGENEWSPLYTVSDGPVKGTVYLNWDDDFLYVGVRTDAPGWVVLNLDGNSDGWLRGADNLELTIGPLSADQQLSARVLDAAGNRDTPVWNEKAVDLKLVQIIQKAAGTGQIVEIGLPKGIAGVNPRLNANLGFRADFLPAGVAPASTQPYEPHLLIDLTLVESRAIAAPGIAPRLLLADAKVVPGQTFQAQLELMNQIDEERAVRTVEWRGEGPAQEILKTVREVSAPSVKSLKTLKLRYSSLLPETAVPGFYQFTAVATLDNGRSVQATTSFQVVEPFAMQLLVSPEAVTVAGPAPIQVVVELSSAFPTFTRGEIEIETPAGWQVKGRTKKGFDVRREDVLLRSRFEVAAPSATQAGDYTIRATLRWHGREWKAARVIKVSRSDAPPAGSGSQP